MIFEVSDEKSGMELREVFETRDLGSMSRLYYVKGDGRILLAARKGKIDDDRDARRWGIDFHGDLLLVSTKEAGAVKCVARFSHGRLEWIRPYGEYPPVLAGLRGW